MKQLMNLIQKLFKKRRLKKYKVWEKEIKFRQPGWFMFLYFFCDRDYLLENIEIPTYRDYVDKNLIKTFIYSSRLTKFVATRVNDEDFTFPFPEKIYNLVYDTSRRLPNEFLYKFYSTMEQVQEVDSNEVNAMEKINNFVFITPHIKKILHVWVKNARSGKKIITDSMKDYEKMFGIFEVNLYSSVANSGFNNLVLKEIKDHVQDLLLIDKGYRSIKSFIVRSFGFIFVCNYAMFAYVIPKIVESSVSDMLPTDISLYNRIGLFLQKPSGVISVVLGLLVLRFSWRYVSSSEIVANWIVSIPKLGDFIRFSEMYLFVNTLCIYYDKLDNSEDIKYREAISIINNNFIRGFFTYKLENVIASSAQFEEFFYNNKVFFGYSDYFSNESKLADKLRTLFVSLQMKKDEVFKSLPENLSDVAALILLVFILISTVLIIRVESWMVSPTQFTA